MVILAAGVIVGIALTYLATVYMLQRNCFMIFWPNKEFDAASWRAVEIGQRYIYAKDLVGTHLMGLTRKEVQDLLGEPDQKSTDNDHVSFDIRYFDFIWLLSSTINFFID